MAMTPFSNNLLDWPAPAKLNLFLHITGRRPDGYHELQTVFQFLNVGDELRFEEVSGSEIVRAEPLAGVPQESDLIVRAARILQERTATQRGIRISLQKNLPMGGGLGGGSSDAATTLVALNTLWDCRLDMDELAALGLQLGADVPVFVRGQAAWAEGVGEHLQPVSLPEPWFLVLVPSVNVSTAEVFSDPQLIRDCPPIRIRDFLDGQAGNVCQPVVSQRFPEVAEALEALGQFADAHMTGTGACVFAAFDRESEALSAQAILSEKWNVFVAKGCNRSPLLARLEREASQQSNS